MNLDPAFVSAVQLVDLLALSTCPNGPACVHPLVQHRYNEPASRWECAHPGCVENPDLVYPTIGVESVRLP